MDQTTSMPNATSSVEMEESAGSRMLLFWQPPEWSLNVELVLMITVFIFGVPGNALIICVQAKIVNKTSTDYLVMVMAMYELIGSSLNSLIKMSYDIPVVWATVSSPFVCKINPSAYNFAQYGAGQTLGVLAVDRLIKTTYPLNQWYSAKVPLVISAVILVNSLGISVPQALVMDWDPVTTRCATTLDGIWVGRYVGIIGSALMLIVFCILSISYAVIAISLRRRHVRKVKRQKNRSAGMSDIAASTMPIEDTIVSGQTSVTGVAEETSVDDSGVQGRQEGAYTINGNEISTDNTTAKIKSKVRTKVLTLEGRNVNKLTFLMFVISLFYIATNVILWYLYVTHGFKLGVGVLTLAYAIPMLNCTSNPIMFYVMSSRFRRNVHLLLCHSKK